MIDKHGLKQLKAIDKPEEQLKTEPKNQLIQKLCC